MKSLVYAVLAASALTIPLASFAQTSNNGPVTREQVRQDLIQLEQNSANPSPTHLTALGRLARRCELVSEGLPGAKIIV